MIVRAEGMGNGKTLALKLKLLWQGKQDGLIRLRAEGAGAMKKLRFLVSLTVSDNDYQQEQARAATEAARFLDADLQVVFAENDAIQQGQQLLEVIQSASPSSRPDGIICHPVGTALERVAAEVVAMGIGWALLNRDADYIPKMRRNPSIPVFQVTVDQEAVGRIQGRQIAALLPQGGLALCLLGPASHGGATLREAGMESTRPRNVQMRKLHGDWTEDGGYRATQSWLRLSTSQHAHLNLVVAQNDNMALGARRALEVHAGQTSWSTLPYLGCDAIRVAGRTWVQKGRLTGSILLPPTAGVAVKLLAEAFRTQSPAPERTLLAPEACPAIEELAPKR